MNFVEVSVDGEGDSARLKGPGEWSVQVPPRFRDGDQLSGRKLVAGFRPEHLDIGDPSGHRASFRARADVVEYLGNEELLHVNAAEQDIVAIVNSKHRVKPDDVLDLIIPLDLLHLFDAETGESLQPRTAATTAA
jgi:ABC-type sugar transport system ATPase subunit